MKPDEWQTQSRLPQVLQAICLRLLTNSDSVGFNLPASHVCSPETAGHVSILQAWASLAA